MRTKVFQQGAGPDLLSGNAEAAYYFFHRLLQYQRIDYIKQILLDSRTFVKGVFKNVRFLFGQLRRHDDRGKLSRRRTSAIIGAAWVSSILSSSSESARLQTGSTIADFVGGE